MASKKHSEAEISNAFQTISEHIDYLRASKQSANSPAFALEVVFISLCMLRFERDRAIFRDLLTNIQDELGALNKPSAEA